MSVLPEQIAALRRFGRFYSREMGLLREGLHDGPFTLTEARVIYELAQRDGASAVDLQRELDLDAGYVSRILARFEAAGLLTRSPDPADARRSVIRLTAAGGAAFAPLNEASRAAAEKRLAPLTAAERSRLVDAMAAIERALGAAGAGGVSGIAIRPHRVGDLGIVVSRHGTLYAQEYGWDISFEALVAEIAAGFIKTYDPAFERCFIAERDGAILGSATLAKADAVTAKLRLVYTEPEARGMGLGGRLVDQCIDFARSVGYGAVTLWTNDVLTAARKLYEKRGFRLEKAEPHRSFGVDLVGEYWRLELA